MQTRKPPYELSWIVNTDVRLESRTRREILRGLVASLLLVPCVLAVLYYSLPSLRGYLPHLWGPLLFAFGGYFGVALIIVPLAKFVSRIFPSKVRVSERGVSVGVRTLPMRDILKVEIDRRDPAVRRLRFEGRKGIRLVVSVPPEVDEALLKEVFGDRMQAIL